tara:strand:- start:1092 stop:1241 length:150 start_codon:yes stop_codon:yes gene_type:complete
MVIRDFNKFTLLKLSIPNIMEIIDLVNKTNKTQQIAYLIDLKMIILVKE